MFQLLTDWNATAGLHAVANPENFRGATSCGGSRISAKGAGQFNMFLSILCSCFRWRGPKSIAKLDGDPWPDLLHPWIRHWLHVCARAHAAWLLFQLLSVVLLTDI